MINLQEIICVPTSPKHSHCGTKWPLWKMDKKNLTEYEEISTLWVKAGIA